MNILKTATGKEFEVDMVAASPSFPYAYIYIKGSDEQTIRNVFSNPAETEQLITKNETINGFTTLGYVMQEGNYWKVRLQRQ